MSFREITELAWGGAPSNLPGHFTKRWFWSTMWVSFLIACATANALNCTPSARQLAWSADEFTALIHLGMNTFAALEWGEGAESPRYFNPRLLNAPQWVDVIRCAGASGAVLVCKHHDGFCLWPSQYTAHSLRQSPWREGRGDVVREVSDACSTAGLRFGVYLSPGDLHEPTYGTDSGATDDLVHSVGFFLFEKPPVFMQDSQTVRWSR